MGGEVLQVKTHLMKHLGLQNFYLVVKINHGSVSTGLIDTALHFIERQNRQETTIRIGIGGDRIDLPKELQTLDNYSATLAHKVLVTMTAMVMAMMVIISGRCNTALNQTASSGRLNTQCMASCPVLGLFISSDSCGLCRKQSHIQFFGQK